jgi:membrane-associated phospholipid phosphatase
MYKLKVLLTVCGILSLPFAFSQPPSDTTNPLGFTKPYFKSFLYDTRDVIIAPIHWQKTQWITASGIIATTGVLIATDPQTHNFFQQKRTTLTNNLSLYAFEPLGSGKYSFPILGAFGLHYAFTHNPRSGRVFFLGTKSLILAGATVFILKNIFQRYRPYQSNPTNAYKWDFINGNFTHNSFPSGHTVVVFSIATTIATEYYDTPVIPIICYTLATLTALSRVNDNKHFLSDVFMGASLGFSISKMVYFRNNWQIRLRKNHSVLVNNFKNNL